MVPNQTAGFPKKARLLRTADFRTVYSEGRRKNLELVIAFALPNGLPQSRIGVTAARSLGGAVERNRAKRRMREAARRHLRELGPGWDIVLNARPEVSSATFAQLEARIRQFFQACSGSLRNEATQGPRASS